MLPERESEASACEQLLPYFSLGCGNAVRALVRAGGE